MRSTFSSGWPSFPLAFSLLALPLLGGLACSSAEGALDDEATSTLAADGITGAHGERCDRSPYNCTVPNFESLPAGVERDRNRAFNHFDGSYYWPLIGEPALRDGDNNVRGQLAGSGKGHNHEVRLNFGARKELGGVPHVYAFAGALTDGRGVSGWIPASAIGRPKTLAEMPEASPENPGAGYYDTDWVVTGGDLQGDHQTLALLEKYGDLRVNPDVTVAERASDYLVRQWDATTGEGYVNFLYGLPHVGGVSRDTLPMCVRFKRLQGVSQLETKLYFTDSPFQSKLALHFVYGTIDGRRGWMTHEMLTRAEDLGKLDPAHPCSPAHAGNPPAGGDPGSSGSDPGSPGSDPGSPGSDPGSPPAAPPVACHVLCCETGAGTGDFSVADGGACIDQAQNFCTAHGHVQSAKGDGNNLYTREGSTENLRCWAKCKARKNYHEVVGVTEDCAGQAKDYCAVGDRGGLGDAKWDRCDPN